MDKRHNLASIIRKRFTQDEDDNNMVCVKPVFNSKSNKGSSSLANLIASKIEDGDITAAIRLLISKDKAVYNSEETFIKLKERHPAAANDRAHYNDPLGTSALRVSDKEVLKAIKSFPTGSFGGTDGLRPRHIIDLVCCKMAGHELLSALTSFINVLLDGRCHPDVIPVLFGRNLTALQKKAGSIRPIAVGYTWRRIAAKCANAYAITKLADYFASCQLGVGISGDCDAVVHATRRFVQTMPNDCVIAKLNFTNAFNSLHRDSMLDAVFQNIPEIYKFCHLAYGKASFLQYGSWTVVFEEGTQQGDPLGPLLFCLIIQPLLSSLDSELVIRLY